jgi:hypothetical protein
MAMHRNTPIASPKSFSQAAINAQTAAIEILGDPSEQENQGRRLRGGAFGNVDFYFCSSDCRVHYRKASH